jgi:hypothetical protein
MPVIVGADAEVSGGDGRGVGSLTEVAAMGTEQERRC